MRSSEPGGSADMGQRNPHHTQDMNIKPITQKPIENSNFVPGHYLRPAHHRSLMETTCSLDKSNPFASVGKDRTRNLSNGILNDTLLN